MDFQHLCELWAEFFVGDLEPLAKSTRFRAQEADRHMLDFVSLHTALSTLAHMHQPGEDPERVLRRAHLLRSLFGSPFFRVFARFNRHPGPDEALLS